MTLYCCVVSFNPEHSNMYITIKIMHQPRFACTNQRPAWADWSCFYALRHFSTALALLLFPYVIFQICLWIIEFLLSSMLSKLILFIINFYALSFSVKGRKRKRSKEEICLDHLLFFLVLKMRVLGFQNFWWTSKVSKLCKGIYINYKIDRHNMK